MEGAIMFGDPLLPSECALIVDELKETSLCFQVSLSSLWGVHGWETEASAATDDDDDAAF